MSSEPLTNGNAPLCPFKILKDLPNVMPVDFVRPDLPSKCTWTKVKDEQAKSPHSKRQLWVFSTYGLDCYKIMFNISDNDCGCGWLIAWESGVRNQVGQNSYKFDCGFHVISRHSETDFAGGNSNRRTINKYYYENDDANFFNQMFFFVTAKSDQRFARTFWMQSEWRRSLSLITSRSRWASSAKCVSATYVEIRYKLITICFTFRCQVRVP